jgi:hypothetical protein
LNVSAFWARDRCTRALEAYTKSTKHGRKQLKRGYAPEYRISSSPSTGSSNSSSTEGRSEKRRKRLVRKFREEQRHKADGAAMVQIRAAAAVPAVHVAPPAAAEVDEGADHDVEGDAKHDHLDAPLDKDGRRDDPHNLDDSIKPLVDSGSEVTITFEEEDMATADVQGRGNQRVTPILGDRADLFLLLTNIRKIRKASAMAKCVFLNDANKVFCVSTDGKKRYSTLAKAAKAGNCFMWGEYVREAQGMFEVDEAIEKPGPAQEESDSSSRSSNPASSDSDSDSDST